VQYTHEITLKIFSKNLGNIPIRQLILRLRIY
jgi:hypothetical protein